MKLDSIQIMKRAVEMVEECNQLLDKITREHYKESYKLNFDNLIDKNGDPIEIDLGDTYEPICVELMEAGRAGRESGQKIKQAFGNE